MSSFYNNEVKPKSHAGLGIVLGILGILLSFLAFLVGVPGGAIALILGIIALLLGIFSLRSAGKGVGAIVTGILAILFAAGLTLGSIKFIETIHNEAVKQNIEISAKITENKYLGILGIGIAAQEENVDAESWRKELERLMK